MTEESARELPRVPAEFLAIGPPMGAGGSAVVWRAQHRVTGTEVALKVWRRPLAGAEQRTQFDAESRLHQQLSGHPHVVRWLWAAAPTDAPAWMATELHGVALSELTADGPLPLAAAVVVGLDLLDGLAAIQAAGVVHRDVKPANVLVHNGRAALCDLGIAIHIDALTRDTCAGTVPYLAPELVGSDQLPDFRSDVYAAARTIRETVGAEVPDALDNLLTRAESTDPADRPADAADFRVRLERVCTELGLDRPADVEGAGAAPRRRRLIVGLAAGVLGLATVGALLAVRTGSDNDPDSVVAPPLAAQIAPPDIDTAGEPVNLGTRSGGECDGSLVKDGRYEHRVDGRVIAVTTVFYDPELGEACALFTKDKADSSYGRPSYLALTLCNPSGLCDSDWFSYPHEAGPVRVQSADGCVSWRASMQDPQGTQWLVRDVTRGVNC